MDSVMESRIVVKRVYEAPAPGDGCRILVDRLWPRGVSKEQAAIDEWMKAIAPSPELRKWFNHQPERFAVFSDSYVRELETDPERAILAARIREMAEKQRATLVYAAKDPVCNHAVVLQRWLTS
ncbi:DUF488 domain-containing protein [Paenibacillus macerans]|uniref:DUF488 domain-containing protein n=1 Tax=Paenibacillus macerans TaxID=44252 RepID=UPI00203FFC4B|nr:DUF488 family protein [Paenibacillus macerans]MCM3701459.1 DUF488 family protein [Paenibacillus macerans]